MMIPDSGSSFKKIFIAVFLFLELICLILVGIVFYNDQKSIKTIIKASETNLVQLQNKIIMDDFRSSLSDLELAASLHRIHLLADGQESSKTDIEEEYLAIATCKGLYDQIRILDQRGLEVVRINYNDGLPEIVPADKLQDKGQRYYFRDTYNLEQGEVFISPMDLNIEKGKVEQPLKPMIRFGIPIFDSKGNKKGIIILNYLADRLLSDFVRVADPKGRQSMLLNSEGFWLEGPDDLQWGFMWPEHRENTFGNRYPQAWSKIINSREGQFFTRDGLFTFTTVTPLQPEARQVSSTGSKEPFSPSVGRLGHKEYYWKIVSYVSPDIFDYRLQQTRKNARLIIFFLTLLSMVLAWIISSTQQKRKKAEDRLILANQNLEEKVTIRTAELEKAKIAAESASDMKSNFLGTINHELRTPLNSILGFADLALSREIDSETRTFVERIRKGGSGLLEIIVTILDLTRATDGKLRLVNKPFRLDHLFDNILAKINPLFRRRIKLIIEGEIPNKVIGDSLRLTEICSRILDNAQKFSGQESPVVMTISLLEIEPQHQVVLEFSVTDQGIGILPEDYQRIFTPFFQVSSSNTRKYQGVGVSLALCKKMVALMAGKIRVESEINKGSTFFFTLSLRCQKDSETLFRYSSPDEEEIPVNDQGPEPEDRIENSVDLDLVGPLIKQLFDLLEKDIGEAIDCLDSLKGYLANGSSSTKEELQRLVNFMKEFDIDESKGSLTKIAKLLEINIE